MKKKFSTSLSVFLFSITISLSHLSNAQSWSNASFGNLNMSEFYYVHDVFEFQGQMHIAGQFITIDGVEVFNVSRWNGTSWEAMGSGHMGGLVRQFEVFNNEMYIASTTGVYKWNGTDWVTTGLNGVNDNSINALYVDQQNNLMYAVGWFTSPGAYVAKYDGSTWTAVGGAIPTGSSNMPSVFALTIYNGEIYIGGNYGLDLPSQFVSKLVNGQWEPLDTYQPSGPVYSFAQKDGKLFMGGSFNRVKRYNDNNDVLLFSRGVIMWDGTNWEELQVDGTGPNTALGGVRSIAVYKNQIFATGIFDNIFGTFETANHIAKWNDCSWSPVNDGNSPVGLQFNLGGSGSNFRGVGLRVMGDNLYVCGEFQTAGAGTVGANVAVWNMPEACPDPICFPAIPEIAINANTSFGCIGTEFTFTASTDTGGDNPTYTWKVDGITAGTNSNTFSSTTLTDGQVVTCELLSNDPCMGSSVGTSNQIQVSIVTEIIPTISISADNTSFCPGSPVNFTSQSTLGGANPTYQWMIDGQAAGTNSPSFTSSSLTNGQNVTCSIVSSESCANLTPVLSNAVTVTETSSIIPTITITADATAICSGTQVNFTASITGGGSNPLYQWMLDGSNVGSNSSTYSNAGLSNGQSIMCMLTSNDVCASPNTATSSAITVTVNTITPSISISASQTSICVGDNVDFTTNINNGGTNPSYQWQIDGTNAGSNSPTFSSSAITNGQSVSCILTSSDVCAVPSNTTSNSITIATTGVTPTISIATNQTTICSGDLLTFTSSITNGGTNPSYQWQINGINSGTNSPTFLTSSLTNGQSVSCILASNESCLNQNNITSNSITVTVNSVSNPTISISSSDNEICSGTNVSFTATVNGGNNISYQWLHNNSFVGTNSSSYNTSSLQNGDYLFCMINSDASCGNSQTEVTSNYIVMSVITDAVVISNGTTLSCLTSGNSYQWIDCGTGNNIVGATNPNFTPDYAGSFKVKVNLDNCDVFSPCLIVFVADLDIVSEQESFNIVYPNPSNGIFNVNLNKEINYQLFDLNGSLIQNGNQNTDFYLDLNNETSGIYFLKVNFINDQKVTWFKLMKN